MPSPRRSHVYWLLQGLGWGLWGLVGGIMAVAFGQFRWVLLLAQAVVAGSLLLGSHLLRGHLRRHGWPLLPLRRLLPRLLAANVLAALGTLLLMSLLITTLLWLSGNMQLSVGADWRRYGGYLMSNSLVLWLWLAVYLGQHYFRRYRQAEVDRWRLAAAAREAEIRTLQAQLNPHFLFNGLNNIRALVMEDPGRARAMMTHLAELLRYAMQRNGAAQVPLATELGIVADYLQLEAMQLEERLTYAADVAPEALAVPLPPMTLQLLVENAVKHGLSPRPAGGTVSLSAWLESRAGHPCLRVTVRNTGHYQPAPGHPGVGLRNVRERLALLYGPAATLTLGPDPHQPDTVLADLTLPAHQPQPPGPPSPAGRPQPAGLPPPLPPGPSSATLPQPADSASLSSPTPIAPVADAHERPAR